MVKKATRKVTVRALSKKIRAVSRKATEGLHRAILMDDFSAAQMTNSQVVRTYSMVRPNVCEIQWGPSHGVNPKTAGWDGQKFTLHSITVNARFSSNSQPNLVNFWVGLVLPTKLGEAQRSATGSLWDSGMDYYRRTDGRFIINPLFYRVLASRSFQLQHLEDLATAPTTDSNQPPRYTERRIRFTHYYKGGLALKKGDHSSVWDLQDTELPRTQMPLLVVMQDNTSLTSFPLMDAHVNLRVTVPT